MSALAHMARRRFAGMLRGTGRRPADRLSHLTVEADRAMVLGGGVAAAVVGALTVWMAWAPLSAAVTVEGVALIDNRKVVQHPTGGIVAEVLVDEGQLVAVGTPLIRLDATAAKAQWEGALSRWMAAESKLARLIAEQNDLVEISLPDEVSREVPSRELAPLLAREQNLMDTRRSKLHLQRRALQSEIAELSAKMKGLEVERDSKAEQSRLIERELQGAAELHSKGFAPLTRLLALQRSRSALHGDRDRAIAHLDELRQAMQGRDLALRRLQADHEAAIADELAQVAGVVEALRATMRDAALRRSLTTIMAPAAGRVIGLMVHNAGAVVGPGAVLLEIVPNGEIAQLEAPVKPADGARVKIGAPVRLRFLGDPAYHAPMFDGRVSYVSDDVMPNGPLAGNYKVKVEMGNLNREVRPGMPVLMFIETERRSPLSYLASPLVDVVARSLREQ